MLFAAALIAGFSYAVAHHLALPADLLIAWKGLGVGLLAIWAARQGRSTDHRLLAAVLLLGAIADMVLELHFIAGAATFVVAHVVAITLYLRHRRVGTGPRDVSLAALWVGGIVVFSAWLAGPLQAGSVGTYALFLALMSASALLSRFPLAAVGGVLFVLSDLLIFARLNGTAVGLANLLVWPLYFGGQALIAWGVARKL